MQTSPLARWDDLAQWASGTAAGETSWDVAAAATRSSGMELRGRIAHGLGHGVDLEAEGFAAEQWGGPLEVGVLAGLSGHF